DAGAVAGLLAELEAERATARGVVVDALSSDRYLSLLDRLEHVSEPELSGHDVALRDLWRAEWRRTRKALARLDEKSADPELHSGGIPGKGARAAPRAA